MIITVVRATVPCWSLAGHVIDGERPGRVKGRARVAFRFTSLRHDGERLALRTDPIVREADATKGEDATKIRVRVR